MRKANSRSREDKHFSPGIELFSHPPPFRLAFLLYGGKGVKIMSRGTGGGGRGEGQ